MKWIFLYISTLLWLSYSVQKLGNKKVQLTKEHYQKQGEKFKYLALGDSYTIGESVQVNKRFPVQLVEKLNAANLNTEPPKIVAKTGWTTDELTAGIENSNLQETYNLVTLLIGVNNQFRGRDTVEYRLQFKELLQIAIGFAEKNAKRVIVVSIPDYGVTPFATNRNPQKIGKEIDFFNNINKQETKNTGSFYINITPISREAKTDTTLIASDKLHPSGEMYKLWVEQILPAAKEILENQKTQ